MTDPLTTVRRALELAERSSRCPAFDAVVAATHPAPEAGGPCATCAFRHGTEANTSGHTVTLAKLCIEGGRYFSCHENPGLCRGFIAAVNLRGDPEFDEIAGACADVLGDAIERVAQAQNRYILEQHGEKP